MTAPTQAPRERPILGLTVHQPWAWFIAQGYKPIENRTWSPPARAVGGYLAVHASKKFNPAEVLSDLNWAWVNSLMPRPLGTLEQLVAQLQVQCGHVLAVTMVTGSVRQSSNRWFFGPVGWTLADTVAIEPVPCRGAQGLWKVPPDVLAAVRERYAAANKPDEVRP